MLTRGSGWPTKASTPNNTKRKRLPKPNEKYHTAELRSTEDGDHKSRQAYRNAKIQKIQGRASAVHLNSPLPLLKPHKH